MEIKRYEITVTESGSLSNQHIMQFFVDAILEIDGREAKKSARPVERTYTGDLVAARQSARKIVADAQAKLTADMAPQDAVATLKAVVNG